MQAKCCCTSSLTAASMPCGKTSLVPILSYRQGACLCVKGSACWAMLVMLLHSRAASRAIHGCGAWLQPLDHLCDLLCCRPSCTSSAMTRIAQVGHCCEGQQHSRQQLTPTKHCWGSVQVNSVTFQRGSVSPADLLVHAAPAQVGTRLYDPATS